jgi:hypothetical protein
MPAFTNMSVGSFCGMSGAEAQTSCPLPAKKERNEARTSDAVFELMIEMLLYHFCDRERDASVRGVTLIR